MSDEIARTQDQIRDGYEAARIANLLHFASLTPGQRVEWLGHALEIYQAIQNSLAEQSKKQDEDPKQ